MLKTAMFSTILISTLVAANIDDFENNFVEYEDVPVQSISLPYPYLDNRAEKVMALETPTYYGDDFGNTVLVPASPKLISSVIPKIISSVAPKAISSTGIIYSVVSYALKVSKAAIMFIVTNGPALILGSLLALGVCKLTPICSTLSQVPSLMELQTEIRSLASPERIARATEFVQNAIKMYESKQDA